MVVSLLRMICFCHSSYEIYIRLKLSAARIVLIFFSWFHLLELLCRAKSYSIRVINLLLKFSLNTKLKLGQG